MFILLALRLSRTSRTVHSPSRVCSTGVNVADRHLDLSKDVADVVHGAADMGYLSATEKCGRT